MSQWPLRQANFNQQKFPRAHLSQKGRHDGCHFFPPFGWQEAKRKPTIFTRSQTDPVALGGRGAGRLSRNFPDVTGPSPNLSKVPWLIPENQAFQGRCHLLVPLPGKWIHEKAVILKKQGHTCEIFHEFRVSVWWALFLVLR